MKHDESVIAFEDASQEALYLVQDRIVLNATLRERGHKREYKKILNDAKELFLTATKETTKTRDILEKDMKNLKDYWSKCAGLEATSRKNNKNK